MVAKPSGGCLYSIPKTERTTPRRSATAFAPRRLSLCAAPFAKGNIFLDCGAAKRHERLLRDSPMKPRKYSYKGTIGSDGELI
jgi:hypothetical protein